MSGNGIAKCNTCGAELPYFDGQLPKTGPDGKIHASTCPGLIVPIPIPMRIPCPDCRTLHIDEGVFATKPHHTHSCQHCGLTWRPAVEHTVGVRFLPGFKNEEPTP